MKIAGCVQSLRRDTPSAAESFESEVLSGLTRNRKRLASKFFYDERGSELFERISQLHEYYLTRTETSILKQHAGQMGNQIGPNALLLELGSGSSTKTQILLDHLMEPIGYVPIDISPAALVRATQRIAHDHPRVPILPVCADYTAGFALPDELSHVRRRIVFFPGSTLGNFEPEESADFLVRIRELCGPQGALLIGVDLKKDPDILHAAYNDCEGVTAQFNLNLLSRINRELMADFDPGQFGHYAFYNPRRGRIEMHLLSLGEQIVTVAGRRIAFRPLESIHTENSYKYNAEDFTALTAAAGFYLERSWFDARGWFGVFLFSTSEVRA